VEYEDRLTIATPEGLELDLALAGLGSRFVGAFVDFMIRALLLAALTVVLVGVDAFTGDTPGGRSGLGLAVFFVASFLVLIGYDILFEVLASGRTPGKRLAGLRVVTASGHPVTFVPSTVRNLVRIVDFLPAGYAIGSIAILATARNQRLGDLVAGTIVVRDRAGRSHDVVVAPSPRAVLTPDALESAAAWDVSAVTAEELTAVRRFLERRHGLDPNARVQLASTLAERLRGKVGGATDGVTTEEFLERIAAAKAART
jgi:uncharacterized RDD family membrane protein YckC